MGVRLVLLVVKQVNKGFTLIEVLVVMFIISVFSVIFMLPVYISSANTSLNILDVQLEAMAKSERVYLNDSIWFNERGNINQAITTNLKGFTCVFQLGFGRFKCE